MKVEEIKWLKLREPEATAIRNETCPPKWQFQRDKDAQRL